MSDTAAAFAGALANLQSDLPHIAKANTADTGSYSYDYADLTDITEAVFPKLAENGLSFICKPTIREDGAFVLRYALKHTEGHEETGDYPLPANGSPQQIGSAISYGRRYCLCAVTGIAPGGDDDDGAKAADTRIQPQRQEPPVETDFMWLEDARHRLVACANKAEVEALVTEARKVFREKRLNAEDAAKFKQETDERLQELTAPIGAPA